VNASADPTGPGAEPVGRVLRWDGTTWQPLGEPLPAFEHAPPMPQLPFAPWVLPRELACRAFDVVVVGELAHQLMAQCAPDDEAVETLLDQTMLFLEPDEAMRWLVQVEVWIGRKLDQSRPWPAPPAG
jgi:hypothetical protein